MEFSITNLLYAIIGIVALVAFNVFNGLGVAENAMIDACIGIVVLGHFAYRAIFTRPLRTV
ncbi:hypothetical protein TALC_00659 [Thermoplasmatales archaeon BRNA1]|nr:hypothetical protein TALC_00659 [Thermoplasmatales archaeon BRNA1]